MKIKCQRCNRKKQRIFQWFGLRLCNACISQIVLALSQPEVTNEGAINSGIPLN